MTLSIVTPWHNCAELIGQYEAAVAGADEVIVVDNGSDAETQAHLANLRTRLKLRGQAILMHRNDENAWFAAACNTGFGYATGDVVLFLNNDIIAQPGWLDQVRADVRDDGLYGPACDTRTVAGQPMTYLDGWCVAARRTTWQALYTLRLGGPGEDSPAMDGPWDAATFPMYYSDVDLSRRAHRAGYPLRVRKWAVTHLSNYTSKRTEGAYADSAAAWKRFTARVEAER